MQFHRRVSIGAIACLCLALGIPSLVLGAITIHTDRATVSVTPIVQKPDAATAWQTVYAYHGGALPPCTRLDVYGKWADPIVHQEADGTRISFPELAGSGEQVLQWKYEIDRPLLNYRTRLTIDYNQIFDKATAAQPIGQWEQLGINIHAGYRDASLLGGDKSPKGLNQTGNNTVVVEFDATHTYSMTVNGVAVDPDLAPKPMDQGGALIGQMITFGTALMQFPTTKGDIVLIRGVSVEQMRPNLATSSVAAIDLTVPGPDSARVNLEVEDKNNITVGTVVHDCLVSPGTYRLYWDGIESLSKAPYLAAPLPAGQFTFRLTTSAVKLARIGDINNSTAPNQPRSYAIVAVSALAMMPPGTQPRKAVYYKDKWYLGQAYVDPKPVDPTDSVMMACVGYDLGLGNWVGKNGEPISTRADNVAGQRGRCIAVAPPGADGLPVMYVSQSIGTVPGLAVETLSPEGELSIGKFLPISGTDWHHDPTDFAAYHIQIGHLPYMLGQKNFLAIQLPDDGEFVVKNVRLYEAGSPQPAPLNFNSAQFTARSWMRKPIVPDGAVTVGDNGTSIDLKFGELNYPLVYQVTPHTVMDFDFKVIKRGTVGRGAGIGLDDDQKRWNPYDLNDPHISDIVNLLTQDPMGGSCDPDVGIHVYPTYTPGILYPDKIVTTPVASAEEQYGEAGDYKLLWLPGYYGVKASEDGKLLFACNNADGRIEVRDMSGDGSLVAKLPVDYPMFLDWSAPGANGAPAGSRWIYVTSPHAGLLRVAWNDAKRTFGTPTVLTPAGEFAYPRGIAYDKVHNRLFVCDAYTPDRSKVANQIDIVDPISGIILKRFGKAGGVDPYTGGDITDDTFTCPLTVAVDSVGDVWMNDFFTGQALKFNVDPKTMEFTVLKRVFGPNNTNTSHFYFPPGGSPQEAWSSVWGFVRHKADIGPGGVYTNQRITGVVRDEDADELRPYLHFTQVNGRTYFMSFHPRTLYPHYDDNGKLMRVDEMFNPHDWTQVVYELVGTKLIKRAEFGRRAVIAARFAGLSNDGLGSPTALDQAAAASGDEAWKGRLWTWSDLNGDGRIEYSANNPEFKIAYNTDLDSNAWGDACPSTSLREGDGAYVVSTNKGLFAIVPKLVDGQLSYDWNDRKPLLAGDFFKSKPTAVDFLADMTHTFVLYNDGNRLAWNPENEENLSAYAPDGSMLWTRLRDIDSPVQIVASGPGMISVAPINGQIDTYGPLYMLTTDGDTVATVPVEEPGDCWGPSVLRTDPDTAYVGWVNVTKVTGLATVKTAHVTADLPANPTFGLAPVPQRAKPSNTRNGPSR